MKIFLSIQFAFLFVLIFSDLVQAQWIQVSGYDGVAFATSSDSSGNIFAGDDVGVMLSTDGGTTWSVVDSGLTNHDVQCLALAANRSGETDLFAGTYLGGVYLSTNDGATWAAVDSGLTNMDIRTLAVSPNGAGGTNVFAGTDGGGVYLSTNNGTSWTAVNTGLYDHSVAALVVNGAILFAATYGEGVFKSGDNGTSWHQVDGLGLFKMRSIAAKENNLYAGTYANGAFRSTDGGTTWAPIDSGLTDSFVWALATCGENLFAGTYQGVFFFNNSTVTWAAVNEGLTTGYVWALTVNRNYLFAGTSAGIWRRPVSEMVASVRPPSRDIPAGFNLGQNYPDPFNPSTTIKYDLPTASSVSLKIYNLLGQTVTTLIEGIQQPGEKSARWNAAGFSCGVYFYKLEATSLDKPAKTFTQVRKMVLMK